MPKKNVTITLTVNVDQLYNGGAIDACCSLSDDNMGNSPNNKPEQFNSDVYAAKSVTWKIKEAGPNKDKYTALLESVTHESGDQIFGSSSLSGGPSGSKQISANVLATAEAGESDTYMITFDITENSTGMDAVYQIDPKLKVHA